MSDTVWCSTPGCLSPVIVLIADVPYCLEDGRACERRSAMTARLCPECEQGKVINCALIALDPETDSFVPRETTGVVP